MIAFTQQAIMSWRSLFLFSFPFIWKTAVTIFAGSSSSLIRIHLRGPADANAALLE